MENSVSCCRKLRYIMHKYKSNLNISQLPQLSIRNFIKNLSVTAEMKFVDLWTRKQDP